jgi:hypothetical protein
VPRIRIAIAFLALCLSATALQAQGDCRSTSVDDLSGCAQRVLSGEPVHVVLTSISPLNGIAAGIGIVRSEPRPDRWRVRWTSEAVASYTSAWRAGTYLQWRRARASDDPTAAPVLNVYAQMTSADRLFFYGLGADSSKANRTVFGLRQAVIGASGVLPLAHRRLAPLHLAVTGEVNGRFVDVFSGNRDVAPSIEDLFSPAEAPGLDDQPAYIQFGEGARLTPAFAKGRINLTYVLQLEQFHSSSTRSSFRRATIDLTHEVALHRPVPLQRKGPWGVVRFRAAASSSSTSAGGAVPFYFQQTLGGTDVDGERSLPSYHDYRFRGPHRLLLQEAIEHSVLGPLGVFVQVDHGMVALARSALGLARLRHSLTIGAIVRGRGLPPMNLSCGWGGPEGHHIMVGANVSFGNGPFRPISD